jgi:hypothetical protein
MKTALLAGLLAAFSAAAHAQPSIEGFWQDIAGRTLFQRDAAPGATIGRWSERELDQTYPHAKQIRKTNDVFELIDLNFNDLDYRVKVLGGSERSIEFIRMTTFAPCAMHHRCSLDGEQLFCAVEKMCYEDGKHQIDWRGEDRYIRRSHCERLGAAQLLGIPVRCR